MKSFKVNLTKGQKERYQRIIQKELAGGPVSEREERLEAKGDRQRMKGLREPSLRNKKACPYYYKVNLAQ